MTAELPETLTLDRIPTPIGTALVVTDEQAVLRAFNWTMAALLVGSLALLL